MRAEPSEVVRQLTVVDTEDALFETLGSGVVVVTFAVFPMTVPAGAVTVTVSVTVAPLAGARVPRLAVKVPAELAQVPAVDVQETKVTPAGIGSLRLTPAADPEPALLIVKV